MQRRRAQPHCLHRSPSRALTPRASKPCGTIADTMAALTMAPATTATRAHRAIVASDAAATLARAGRPELAPIRAGGVPISGIISEQRLTELHCGSDRPHRAVFSCLGCVSSRDGDLEHFRGEPRWERNRGIRSSCDESASRIDSDPCVAATLGLPLTRWAAHTHHREQITGTARGQDGYLAAPFRKLDPQLL